MIQFIESKFKTHPQTLLTVVIYVVCWEPPTWQKRRNLSLNL